MTFLACGAQADVRAGDGVFLKQLKFFSLNFFIIVAAFCSHAEASLKELQVKEIKPGLSCMTTADDHEWANSFLLRGEIGSILIDAGWPEGVEIPVGLKAGVEKSQKVSTHFHFDHIRQWNKMGNIFLTDSQAKVCDSGSCSPSLWQSIMSIKPFQISGKISENSPTDQVNPRLISISCKGHSPTDACFLDVQTRTLFVGDLFYLGPVFYFLPGSDVSVAIETLENLLKRTDWDQVALTHGECLADRSKVVEFVEDLKQIVAKKVSWEINFDFWIPLRAYKIRSGYVVTNIIW